MTLDELKQREEIAKLRIERLKAAGGLCVAASSAGGLVGIFFYCFVFIGFLPAGLNVSDTFFFVFAMLAFSLAGGLSGLFGLLAYTPYVLKKPVGVTAPAAPWIIRKDNSAITLAVLALAGALASHLCIGVMARGHGLSDILDSLSVLMFLVLGIGHFWISLALVKNVLEALLCLLVWLVFTGFSGLLATAIATTHGGTYFQAFALICIVLTSGLCLAFAFAVLEDPAPAASAPPTPTPPPLPLPAPAPAPAPAPSTIKYRVAGIFFCIGILLPYIPALTAGPIVNSVMQQLGLRANAATLLVNAANYATLEAAADTNGLFLYSCKENGDTYAVSNVRVLWHGIGQRSYVELLAPAQAPEIEGRAVQVELDSAGVKKSKATRTASCAELKRGVYFDSNNPTLADTQWALTLPFIRNFFAAAHRQNSKVVVVGHADPMQPSSKSNFQLAQARACDVANKLFEEKLASAEATWIDVRLDGDVASKCKDAKGAAEQRACFETERRVEVQLVQASGKLLRAGTAKALDACPRTAAPASGKRRH
jgi:outer membrane protein OmpA-like peptidoglycan-associated protein